MRNSIMLTTILQFMAYSFVFCVGLFVFTVVVLFIIDKTQTSHAIRHNYPVIGRLRYYFEHVGVFFRQYFFAMDREELPFNRSQRSWVYRAAKNIDSTVPFGSTYPARGVGATFFSHSMYPTEHDDYQDVADVTIGPYSKNPYTHNSVINVSAMSFGSLSQPAIQALSRGAADAGIWLNTGEGGLSPYHLEGGCDIVFQMGTAKFGVRDAEGNLSDKKLEEVAAHEQVKMIEVKLSQGAKPGKGGILPGVKVTPEIAKIRGIPVEKDAISPNRFVEIENPDTLIDFICHIREVSGLPVGIKFCVGTLDEVELLCKAIKKRGTEYAPDFFTIDSSDGGTGAAPMALIDHVGMPIKESLPAIVHLLQKYDLRERIKIIAAGKLVNPADVAWALCAGADFINSARGFLFSLGCIQALQCNKNTCPTGITTHNKRLQRGLNIDDKSTRVSNYANNMQKEVEIIAHCCGVKHSRALQPCHMRVVQTADTSKSLEELSQKYDNNG